MSHASPFACIADIHTLLEKWRTLGSRTLPSGTQLIAMAPDGETNHWLHVVYPGLSRDELESLQDLMPMPLPSALRKFYRVCSGMTLWDGSFRVFGYNPTYPGTHGATRFPDDVLRFNHEIDSFGWLPRQAFAFAENGWDLSVHVIGLHNDPDEVHRVDRATGRVLEVHDDIWSCIAARLYRIDELLL